MGGQNWHPTQAKVLTVLLDRKPKSAVNIASLTGLGLKAVQEAVVDSQYFRVRYSRIANATDVNMSGSIANGPRPITAFLVPHRMRLGRDELVRNSDPILKKALIDHN